MYIEKKKKKRKIPRKILFFGVSVLLVLTVLIVGLVMVLTKGAEVKDSLTLMPFGIHDTYLCVNNTIVYSEGDLLTCVNASMEQKWQLRMYTSGLNYTASNTIIVATSDTVIQVISSEGKPLFVKQLEDCTIQSVRAGGSQVAVYVEQKASDTTLYYILVFDLSGNDIYKLPMTGYNVLDYGFDGNNEELYVLELDVDGVAPISRIYTYRPKTQTMTGINDLTDQLVGCVYIFGDDIYAMGTSYLTTFKSLKQSQKRLIYGWCLEDLYDGEDPVFVYAQSAEMGSTLSSVRLIRTSGDELKLNLPSGVFSVQYTGEKIYCFASDRIFVYTVEGKYLRMHPLPFTIDSVSKAIDGYAFVTVGESVYLLPLP